MNEPNAEQPGLIPVEAVGAAPVRRRKTRRRVHAMDAFTTVFITIGGLGVVAAVLGICVYLTVEVADLFRPGHASAPSVIHVAVEPGALWATLDEHRSVLMVMGGDGVLRGYEAATGLPAFERRIAPEGRTVTAWSRSPREGYVSLGYDDGSVQVGKITTAARFLLDPESAVALSTLAVGGTRIHDAGVVTRTVLGQLRLCEPIVDLPAPVALERGSGAVRRIDYLPSGAGELMVAIREDGTGALERVRRITPLGGGPSRAKLTHHDFPFEPRATGDRLPRWLFGTGDASMVLAVWEDGECRRFSIADPERPELIETVNLVAPGRRLTSVTMLVGAKTMIVGDDGGNLSGWFAARTPDTTNADRQRWVRAHDLGAMSGPVTSLYPSERDRNFVAADAGGTLRLLNMTSGKTVVEVSEGRLGAPRLAMIAPKGDGLAALGVSGTLTTWDVFAGHPEATMASLFGRVWYEGDPEPSHTYQSSSGDDAAEPKLGLAPLIWGTLKATIYTMVFAVPLAILAALCTSEFLDRRVRGAVKPLIEMMASLPSVVLGFVTAMLVAPFVKSHLSAVLSAFLTIPIGVLLCAHAWQAVPPRVARFVPSWARAALMATAFMFSATAAAWVGPTLERTLFAPSEAEVLVLAGSHEALPREQWPAWVGSRNDLTAIEGRRLQREGLFWRDGRVVRPKGSLTDPEVRAVVLRHSWDRGDLRQWLNGAYGGAWPGWLLLVFPGAAIFVSIAMGRRIASLARMTGLGDSHLGAAATEGIRLVFALVSAGALASVAASVLTACDLDTRDSIFGTFQQRNTLVVALAMSVAVIPIIYTICEDSMSAVPEGLRSASLAAGATRWQTAVRIVLPVAGSGVFSAVMIGLGRAAGETMVVLMATGNTPIMSASLFDGLRSLSANIAVELPEAAQGSTHYRVLFLCGLVLFVMTFAVNSLAEVVRQRFRRRSASL